MKFSANSQKFKTTLGTGEKSFKSGMQIDNTVGVPVVHDDHTLLTNRDAADQHPMSAITGLEDAIAEKISRADLQSSINTALAQAKASGEFDGKDGADGKDGTNGKDGAQGVQGEKGADGHSPVITASKSGTVTTISVDGAAIATINDGEKGADGAQGKDGATGADGKTPVKGTDYWTDADKSEIVADTKEAIDLSSYAEKTELENYLPLTGGTCTGGVTAPNFQTGSDNAAYFQTKKMRGEGNADTYYHAVDWGYANHNVVDFHEYGGIWRFFKNTGGKSNSGTLVGSIQSNGWNGGAVLTGTPTAPTAAEGTNTTQIATTEFVQAAIQKALKDAGLITE